MQHREPQRKKTLAPRLASPLAVPTRYGVITLMICGNLSAPIVQFQRIKVLTQFQNQLEAVDNPTPRLRIGSGKIYPITTQAAGPQVAAKNMMLMQMKAIMAFTAELLCFSTRPAVTPRMPTMNWAIIMPAPPKMRIFRRPSFSIM